MALGKKITDQEKQLFVGLHNGGMGTPQIARITNRSESTVRRFTTGNEIIDDKTTYLIDEEMFQIFDNHAAGKSNVDIAIELNRPQQTVSKVVRREYVKHQKAYAKWLEIQKEKDAPDLVMEVQPVEEPAVHPAILAIRAAHAAGRTSQPAPVEPECVDFRSKYFALLEEHSRVMADYIKSLKAL
jgi:hypothetical protein